MSLEGNSILTGLVTGCRGCYLVCRGRGSRLHCPDRIARAIVYRLMIWH